MTIDGDNLLGSILASLDRIQYIEAEEIPNIDLYMDQVTGFMDDRLKSTARRTGDERILTKTMINNYAKNDLIPPPIKKKYSKEHIILLIFIYYYKGILSIGDIQKLLSPIVDQFYQTKDSFNLESIYEEAVKLEKAQLDGLKEDVIRKFHEAEKTFEDAPEGGKDFLQKFAFICMLSHDVYVKKLMIEKMIDELSVPQKGKGRAKKTPAQDTGAKTS